MNLSTALTDRMNFLVARQGVIAGNIANANTPGYLAKDISFQSAVSGAMAPLVLTGTNGKHLTGGADGATSKGSTSARFVEHNGNAVRLDQEMLRQQETELNYRFMTQLYTKQMSLQKLALTGKTA